MCPPVAIVAAVAAVLLGAAGTPAAAMPGGGPAPGRWSIEKAYLAAVTPSAVSCPTRADCFALARADGGFSTVIHGTTGGRSWRGQTLPGTGLSLNTIACPTTSDCLPWVSVPPPLSLPPTEDADGRHKVSRAGSGT
jgi:hypothetical protein